MQLLPGSQLGSGALFFQFQPQSESNRPTDLALNISNRCTCFSLQLHSLVTSFIIMLVSVPVEVRSNGIKFHFSGFSLQYQEEAEFKLPKKSNTPRCLTSLVANVGTFWWIFYLVLFQSCHSNSQCISQQLLCTVLPLSSLTQVLQLLLLDVSVNFGEIITQMHDSIYW
jgi:hypothetical protein